MTTEMLGLRALGVGEPERAVGWLWGADVAPTTPKPLGMLESHQQNPMSLYPCFSKKFFPRPRGP